MQKKWNFFEGKRWGMELEGGGNGMFIKQKGDSGWGKILSDSKTA